MRSSARSWHAEWQQTCARLQDEIEFYAWNASLCMCPETCPWQDGNSFLNAAMEKYSVSQEEWDLSDNFSAGFTLFHEASDILSCSKRVTASSVLRIVQGLIHWWIGIWGFGGAPFWCSSANKCSFGFVGGCVWANEGEDLTVQGDGES